MPAGTPGGAYVGRLFRSEHKISISGLLVCRVFDEGVCFPALSKR